MGQVQRGGHMDVSNTVDVSDWAAVAAVVRDTLQSCYPTADFSPLEVLFRDFRRLYSGNFPGYRACDIKYHNSQHVLDVTLAMARLLDGHFRSHAGAERLAADLALAGIATALFHDAGYIRSTRDTRNKNGAAYTRVHVSRGARFLGRYLPQVGLGHLAPLCTRTIHFTGYETSPDDLVACSEQERLLGFLLGTADLIAQLADIDYVRKCREYLYEEFVVGGMAGEAGTGTIYSSPEQLLSMTPAFIRDTIAVRLNGQFHGVHRYAAAHFGGRHLYMAAIQENCCSLEALLAGDG